MQLNEVNERFSSSTVSTFKSTSSFNFQLIIHCELRAFKSPVSGTFCINR